MSYTIEQLLALFVASEPPENIEQYGAYGSKECVPPIDKEKYPPVCRRIVLREDEKQGSSQHVQGKQYHNQKPNSYSNTKDFQKKPNSKIFKPTDASVKVEEGFQDVDFSWGKKKETKPIEEPTFNPKPISSFSPQSPPGFDQHPAASFNPKPVASFNPQPAASFNPQPAASFNPQPAASFNPQPAASFNPQPASSFNPQPASSFNPQPAASFNPQPASSFNQQPAASFNPQPATGFNPQPAAGFNPQPAAGFNPQKIGNKQSDFPSFNELEKEALQEKKQATTKRPHAPPPSSSEWPSLSNSSAPPAKKVSAWDNL